MIQEKEKRREKVKPIFIHIAYHTREIQWNNLQSIYNKTLAQEILTKIIIAIWRQKIYKRDYATQDYQMSHTTTHPISSNKKDNNARPV